MDMEAGPALPITSVPPAQNATLLIIKWGCLIGSGPRFNKTPGPQYPSASLHPAIFHLLLRDSLSTNAQSLTPLVFIHVFTVCLPLAGGPRE